MNFIKLIILGATAKVCRKRIAFFLFTALLLNSVISNSQPLKPSDSTNTKTLRILVIGNSFSKNATLYLPELAEEGGHKLTIQKAEISGATLKMHWDAVQIANSNPDNPKGKPYGGKSLKMLLMSADFDFITFQQASTLSAYPGSYNPFIEDLYNFVREYQPRAEILIHQTWPYRTDAKTFSKITEDDRATSAREMWKKSRAAYHIIARELNARIIPTGDAFQAINASRKWCFVPDRNFDFEKPIYPELPNETNSLNVGYTWDKKRDFKFDPNHASPAGCYLGSLTWYGVLFNESPINLKFVPATVPAEFAKQLRKASWRVVSKQRH